MTRKKTAHEPVLSHQPEDVQPKTKGTIKVVGDPTEPGSPTAKRVPRPLRVSTVEDGEGLPPNEAKKLFARNLDQLLRATGLGRKEFAEQVGVPYKLVRRLVTEGISRPDERSAENLAKIVRYFVLPDARSLWRRGLLDSLLNTLQGDPFLEKFRPKLEEQRRVWLATIDEVDHETLGMISKALGFVTTTEARRHFPNELNKVQLILTSPKAAQFLQLIEDYIELITPKLTEAV